VQEERGDTGPASPLDVDIACAYAICLRAARAVDFACLVPPPLPYGLAPYNTGLDRHCDA
jgi:creatinine amidohydrolase/Fe(II)-dependent formamide hydrolase-like protein